MSAPQSNDFEQQQLELARSFIGQDRLAEAAEILTSLVLSETVLFEPYYDLACLAVRQGDVDTAISLFGMALERQPDFAPARRNLALMLGSEHRFDDAFAALSPVLRSANVTQDDLETLRGLLEATPRLSSVSWARLLVDLAARTPKAAGIVKADPQPDSASFHEALGYLSARQLCGFKSFANADEYFAWDRQVGTVQEAVEGHIEKLPALHGYCQLCGSATSFKVSSGLMLQDHVHLREGMICVHCGIHNRGRLLGLSISAEVQQDETRKILLMESTTPLYRLLRQRFPNLVGSEFVAPHLAGGQETDVGVLRVRHESILDLSFPTGSLDLVAHADVLEHIPDVERALAESFRILKPGGRLIFSAPFSQRLEKSQKRAVLKASGEVEHLLPAEYHGTHLVYYNYGWDLLDLCRAAGFTEVSIGVCFDPLQGLLSTGRFGESYMQPIVFSCLR